MTDPGSSYRAIAGDVYHTHAHCPIGRQIPSEWRREGSASLPLCPACRARADAERRHEPATTPDVTGGDSRTSPRKEGEP
jgi:hypothetical protein